MGDEIISVRGLVDSEFGTPLREFKGTLDSYAPEDRKFGTFVVLNFKDVDVIEAAEPYNFPTAIIAIKFSKTKKSGWGIFGDSLAVFLAPDEDLKDGISREFHMQMELGHSFGVDKNTGEEMVGNVWHVLALSGSDVTSVGLVTGADRALEIVVGKTRAEFNKAAYQDPIIRKDTELQRSITNKSFITALLQSGDIVEDENGVFAIPSVSEAVDQQLAKG